MLAHCALTALWAFGPASRGAADRAFAVCSVRLISFFTFVLHFCVVGKHLPVSSADDGCILHLRGLAACISTFCAQKGIINSHMKRLTSVPVRDLTDSLSQTGKDRHVLFSQIPADPWLSSYPSLHVTVIWLWSSYQPFVFAAMFPFLMVGGRHAFLPEDKKERITAALGIYMNVSDTRPAPQSCQTAELSIVLLPFSHI